MNNKTLETALLYLSGGFLVISLLEIFSRGLGFGYIWLMIAVILFLGYTILKRKRVAQEGRPENKKPAGKNEKQASRTAHTGTSVSKSKRKRK